MSVFTKPISQLLTTDLQDLVAVKAVENLRLEFKLKVPDKDETLKKLSAFANTYGGLMVVGAQADSTDGRIQSLPGVELESGYKQKIAQWCFDGAMPPLIVEVSDPISTPANDGKVCYVIAAPESDLAPHFLNGRKGVYVRTDEFSARFEARLADEREMRRLLDRRRSVVEHRDQLIKRARTRFDVYYTSKTGSAMLGPRLEITIVPRFPSRPLCDHQKLGSLAATTIISWRQFGFPQSRGEAVSQHESVVLLDPAGQRSLLEANIWGMLFYGIPIDYKDQNHDGIHLHGLLGVVLAVLRHSGAMLKSLGYSGSLIIQMSLAQVRGLPWLHSREGPWLSERPGSPIDNNVVFSLDSSAESLHADPDGVAKNLLRYLLLSANLADLVDSPEKLERLISDGYRFNNWSSSAAKP